MHTHLLLQLPVRAISHVNMLAFVSWPARRMRGPTLKTATLTHSKQAPAAARSRTPNPYYLVPSACMRTPGRPSGGWPAPPARRTSTQCARAPTPSAWAAAALLGVHARSMLFPPSPAGHRSDKFGGLEAESMPACLQEGNETGTLHIRHDTLCNPCIGWIQLHSMPAAQGQTGVCALPQSPAASCCEVAERPPRSR